jgi:hypothetical protein
MMYYEWRNQKRRFKEYYPYTIAKDNGDKYRSVGFEHDGLEVNADETSARQQAGRMRYVALRRAT